MFLPKRTAPGLFVAALAFSLCLATGSSAAVHKTVRKPAKQPAAHAPAANAPQAVAPAAPGDILLYNGQASDQAGVTLAAWGGGTAQDSTESSFSNNHSLKVITSDLYQGGRMTFNTPVALSGASATPNRYFQMTIRVAAGPTTYAPTMPQGYPGYGGAPEGKGMQGMRLRGAPARLQSGTYQGGASLRLIQRRRGGFGGPGGFRPGPGGMRPGPPGGYPGPPGGYPGPPQGGYPRPGVGPEQGSPAPAESAPPVKSVRLVFTLANGAQADILRPVAIPTDDMGNPDLSQWINIDVPVTALKFSGVADSALKSVTLGADSYATLYIGQIKLLSDDTPITCFAGDQQNVAAGDLVTLHGTAAGGASMLKYSWDFDQKDGITQQSEGQTVYTQYYKGGKDYTVTLTVSDLDGLKKPASSTTVVHVEQ